MRPPKTLTRWRRLGLGVLLVAPALASPAAWCSSLAAWTLNSQRLELRTTPEVMPGAFFQAGSAGQGPRVWVDLPGEPSRTRSLPGRGPITEVRIGRPSPNTTRIVVQFAPGVRLHPADLSLVGTARDRWRMEFKAIERDARFTLVPSAVLSMGEGDLDAPAAGPPVPMGRFKVVIDPGHGGPDPGAVGIGGLRETDVVLDVCLQLARLLQARGVQVLMTRTSEVDVDLPPRVSLANNSRADAFVSVHANALSLDRPEVNGIESFYFEGAGAPSRSLAAALQQQMLAISPGSPDRGVRTARFFVIRRTVMPSTLVEMGFVTGTLDAPRLADPTYRRRMAMALAAGVLNFLQGRP
ncbi:MAG: N-acetylmuramoyl-L-alanine amidase [Synechococcaceae bacterium WB9_2_170]|nr:N-acetylmuramoyl-L-alanine amidase [Synechococcaceae bacterium WB9_2_170]